MSAVTQKPRREYGQDFLQEVVDQYPIAVEIRHISRFDLGFEDTNYLLEVGGKKYVLKIFETSDIPEGSFLFKAEVMDISYQGGLKTPLVHRDRNNALVTRCEGKQCLLMDFIEGDNMAERQFSDELIHEVGREAGKMDALLASINDRSRVSAELSLDLKNFLHREADIDKLPPEFDRNIFYSAIEAHKKIKSAFDLLPSGVIHYDIVAHNVIARHGKLSAIIDFSDVVFAPYAQNVAASLCQTVFWYNWQPHQAGIFLKGYRKFNTFSPKEEALLYDLTVARYVALIIGLNNRTLRFGLDERRARYMNDRYLHLKRLIEFGREQFNNSLIVPESVVLPQQVIV